MIAKFKQLFHSVIQYATTKRFSDDYIDWLTFSNAGMLSKGNIHAMRHAIKNLPSTAPVLEIGSFCGLSVNVISYLLSVEGKSNKIVTSDKWLFEGAENGGTLGSSRITHPQYRQFVKSSFMKNVEFFSPHNKPYTIEELSDDFFALWKQGETRSDVFGREIRLGGAIGFCYIDGNHTYDFARRDFENLDPHLEPGGFVLFDDSSDMNRFGLTKLMKEIRKNKKYQLVMKNPNYLFRKHPVSDSGG